MNITIDTINKEITLNENVNLHDFYEEINTLLPGGKWREFTLKTNIKLDINNPVPWGDWVTPNPYQSPPQPITTPYWDVTCGGPGSNINETTLTSLYNHFRDNDTTNPNRIGDHLTNEITF